LIVRERQSRRVMGEGAGEWEARGIEEEEGDGCFKRRAIEAAALSARFRPPSLSIEEQPSALSSSIISFFASFAPAFARPRGRQIARQGKPTTVAHHLEFLKRGAGCLRTTRRGGEKVWKREKRK